jgi:hypothetical protein
VGVKKIFLRKHTEKTPGKRGEKKGGRPSEDRNITPTSPTGISGKFSYTKVA